eukprot:scaffold8075_cov115-Isochrysis_galbana.AAC.3
MSCYIVCTRPCGARRPLGVAARARARVCAHKAHRASESCARASATHAARMKERECTVAVAKPKRMRAAPAAS